MKNEYLEAVRREDALAIITDSEDKIIWQTGESPVSSVYKFYFENDPWDKKNLILYSNQAGLAMAILAEKMDIRVCFAYRVSEVGLKKFMENGVEVYYEERIPLVKSSKNPSKVCPIEDFLSKHNDAAEQWKFLEERQKGTAYREGDVSL